MTEAEARKIAMSKMPRGSEFVKSAEYGNFYIFHINFADPIEGNFDPFFSVDKTTGAFSDFSIIDGGPELLKQFV